ncbi:acyl carrier protein [Desulfonema ishimotonii]|uniref:Acyl carrier protein n=1 Tax=Desulfonema ishimotonii TaxID=45657 RepID=A0A401G3H6_9BACT|nr:acyl carrier protein [Desulfonema ishimotonii]GBC63766.1 acyl carrier protein [Desulfonema ishimotonii]
METRKIIRTFMSTALKDEGFNENIKDDASLIDLGILDSLSILQLLDFFDDKFGIIPDEDEFHPENFDSVQTIAAFIEKKSGRGTS